jgi:SRSO17 transposase
VYLSEYEHIFKNKTKSNFNKATLYVEGLVVSELKNIERISEKLEANYHQMQHFITESEWDYRLVIDKVAKEVSNILPKTKLTGLLIDESGWVKKGDKSVGVGHQYCGNVGKISNSQVAVFGCLSNDKYASLIDTKLYLPKDWCDNIERCQEAGVPASEIKFRTKLELAIEIIKHQQAIGTAFDYVGADGFYGNDANFAKEIDLLGLIYMLDIHSDQTIYLEKPELYLPERKSIKGPKPKKPKATTQEITVNKYLKTLKSEDWQKINIRNSTKGMLKGEFHFKTVYIWNKKDNTIENRLLVIRKTKTKKGEFEIKYSFTNANLIQYTQEGIAQMQSQRFFVEHSFKESKQILGLDQFQTRKWKSWHHQVALNFMVSSFMLQEKLLQQDEIPLLTARDIMDFMIFKFYKEMTEEKILNQLKERHRKRIIDINYFYSKY